MQQGDVKLFQTNDDGDMEIVGGVATMGGGLDTAVYLSLFGGNFDDDGSQETPQWWGGIDEVFGYRSETQFLLHSLVAIPANLQLLSDAIKRDLSWLILSKAATGLSVAVGMPAAKRIDIAVTINGDETIKFTENWGAML